MTYSTSKPGDIQQALINEVHRLAAERSDGNCTRDYFRNNADFTIHAVEREFGTFTNLRIAAGLQPGKFTRKIENRQGQLVLDQTRLDYIEKYVAPWSRESNEFEEDQITMVIGSDFHGESVDRFGLDVFIDTIASIQPHHVVLNGDIVDFEPIGRWAKRPNVLFDLQAEIDFTVDNILRPVREAAPDAQIDFQIGNHEYRMCSYLAEQSPGLASLRCLSFGELFHLTELDIGLILGGNILAPTLTDQKREVAKAYKVYYDTFVVTHGTATGPSAAATELNRFNMSGCSGHLHRHSYASGATLDRPFIEWHVMPKMTEDSVADVYGKGLPLGWHTGFAVVDIFPESKTHFFNPVHIRNGIAMNGGTVYRDASRR